MKTLLPFFALPFILAASYGVHTFYYHSNGNSLALEKSLQRADLLVIQQDFSGAVQQLSVIASQQSSTAITAQQRIISLCQDDRLAALEIRSFQQFIQTLLRQKGDIRPLIQQQLWQQGNSDELSLQQRFIITQSMANEADGLTTIALDEHDVTLRLISLYQQWLALHPADHQAAQELAVLYFKQRRINEMVALLQPHQQHLGSSEAASILGQLYYSAKNYNAAEKFLIDYSLPRLQAIEQLKQHITHTEDTVTSVGAAGQSTKKPQPREQTQRIATLQQQLTAISPVAEQLASLLVFLANSNKQPQHRQQRLDRADWILTTLQPLEIANE
ncbi:hypothetical protein SIN8267_00734 [Sinobacterium norvegicum]|uniref:Uncharacterized protein n=1 Tax=Sinobacterium norvegicum TaxID=1641715 RepID=A0ABN8EFZ6_9GAMM|nr:CDC27 family protein [Sinobacterium norvegicum]CAH0990640.1 hypothetical protein SIN8267_00734 [Sinobacterium norvegicum]